MPSSKRKKDPEESSLPYKLLAVCLILTLAAVFAYALQKRKSTVQKPKKPSSEKVLGTKIHNTPVEDLQNLSSAVQAGAESIKNSVQQGAAEVLGAATERTTQFVLENAAGGLVSQIDKLPDDQKKELKKQICQ